MIIDREKELNPGNIFSELAFEEMFQKYDAILQGDPMLWKVYMYQNRDFCFINSDGLVDIDVDAIKAREKRYIDEYPVSNGLDEDWLDYLEENKEDFELNEWCWGDQKQ
jgi:hypothetical protein